MKKSLANNKAILKKVYSSYFPKIRNNNSLFTFRKNSMVGIPYKQFSETGNFLDKKYYDINRSPLTLSESITKPSVQLEDYIKKEQKEEQLFLTKEKEKMFLENESIQFNLPKTTYIKYLEKGMLGNAEKITFKDVEIYFISTIYERIDVVNIFRLLNYINPDMIQVQIKPERIIKNIEMFYAKENLVDNLVREAWELQPSIDLKNHNFKKLLDNNILITSRAKDEEIISKQKNFYDLNNFDPDRISVEAVSMISLWAEENKRNILISDSPEALMMEKISNNNSLVYIREIFKNSFIQFPNNPDYEPRTIIATATNLYPDIFLNISDAFIANVINQICKMDKEKRPKKIVAFLGYGQSKSIPNYLKFDVERNNIVKIFDNDKRYESVIYGEDTLEILVEKWALLAIMMRGIGLKQNVNVKSSDLLIDTLIKKYARQEYIQTGFNSEDFLISRMKHLFDELVKEKKILSLEYLMEGHKSKKKQFMKRIFDDPILNSQLN